MSKTNSQWNPIDMDDSFNNNDRNKLLQVFPNEIWLQILSCIENPEDLKHVNLASSFFGQLLQPRKADYLFPMAWAVLVDKFYQDPSFLPQSRRKARKVPITHRNHWFTPILELRLISKMCKDAIDKFYWKPLERLWKNGNASIDQFTSRWDVRRRSMKWAQETFSINAHVRSESIRVFLAHFQNSHGSVEGTISPFFTGDVCFVVPSWWHPEFNEFDQLVCELLASYGKHIQNCQFEFVDRCITPTTFGSLMKWLSFLPNVTGVAIFFNRFMHSTYSSSLPGEYPVIGAENAVDLVPPLTKLQNLALHNVDSWFGNRILRTLRLNLSVLRVFKETESEIDLYSDEFPNLENLSITFQSMSEFHKLETAQFSSIFKCLYVTLDFERPAYEEVYSLLARKWRSSLTQLKIMVPPVCWSRSKSGYTSTEEEIRQTERMKALQNDFLPGVKFHESGLRTVYINDF